MDDIQLSVKAQEAIKDPSTYSWLTYLWVIFLSAWGGVVRFLQNIKDRKDKKMTLKRVFIELAIGACTSIFVGVLTFYICEAAHFQPLWTAVCVAVTGHMGAEGLMLVRKAVANKLGVD